MKKLFFLLVALSCVLLNCSKDNKGVEDPNEEPETPVGTTLSLSPEDLVFEAAGGWKEFTINCSGAWTLTGGSAWCQPGATSGSGRSQVKVMAEASTLTSDRNVNLTVRCGSQTKVLAVTQKGVNALTLSKDKFEVESDGGDLTVTLQANVECTSAIPSAFFSWIKKATGTKAMTSQSFRYTVSPNEDTQKREGYIVFTGGTKKDTVYVYQSAKTPTEESSLILSEDTYDLSAEAQKITVELKTNIDYEVIVPDSVETWVVYLTTRAIRTDKLHFSIAENEGDNTRSAVVIIREQGGELTDTLHIRQAKQESIEATGNFPKTVYILDYHSGSDTIEFSVPDAWEASISYEGEDSGWLSLSAESGKAGKAKLTVTATQNATAILRQAFIDITFGDKKQRLTVTQRINENTDITDKFDPDFARVLQEKGYIKDAKHITGGEVSKITEVNVNGTQLTSLMGIEYFTSLKKLECIQNEISVLDVSKNTELMHLICWSNQLANLDVSKNTALVELNCDVNKLKTLDVTKNTELTKLCCSTNELTTLNVTENTKLTALACTHNQLTTLDVSKNTELAELKCWNNPGNGTVFPLTAWFDEDNMPQYQLKEWTYNGKRITLQLQKSGSEAPYLVLSQKNLEMSASGGTVAVTVSTNVAYDVVIPAEVKTWISQTSGESNEIRFDISTNEGEKAREARIVVKARDRELSDTLHIIQSFKNMLTLTKKEYQVKAEGETFSVELQTNLEYDIFIPYDGRSWISRVATVNGLQFSVAANEDSDARESMIIIRSLKNALSDTLYVFQEQKDMIVLSEKRYLVSREKQEISVEIKSNVEYDVTISTQSQSWIEEVPLSKSLTTNMLRYAIAYNGTSDDRVGEIIVKSRNSSLADTVQVVQGGYGTYVGDIVLATAEDVNNFSKNQYTKIIGDIVIKDRVQSVSLNRLSEIDGSLIVEKSLLTNFEFNSLTKITKDFLIKNGKILSLSGFGKLESIGGDFRIIALDGVGYGYESLTFEGLKCLKSIDGCFEVTHGDGVSCFDKLSSFSGLDNLEYIGGDFKVIGTVFSFESLTSFKGLGNLRKIGGRFEVVGEFKKLSSFAGLKKLESVGGFRLEPVFNDDCKLLASFSGLDNLKNVGGDFEIIIKQGSLSALNSFSGLGSLKTIEGNFNVECVLGSYDALSSFVGLDNLESVGGDFTLKGNKFSSFVGLENLRNIGGSLNLNSLSVLSSFAGLENLKNIGGDFYLEDLLVLPSFTGLGNLRSIGGSFKLFGYLDGLSSFAGLKSLESIGEDFVLKPNLRRPFLSLSSFIGLENLRSIGRDFYLCCSSSTFWSWSDPFPVLSSFSGLENLESIGRDFKLKFGYTYNAFPSLSSFNGLGNLKSIGRDFLLHPGGSDPADNAFPVLTSLTGLGSLKSIGGDFDLLWLSSLLSLNGLENLDVIKGYIYISECKSLVDTSALKEEVRKTAKGTIIFLEKQD